MLSDKIEGMTADGIYQKLINSFKASYNIHSISEVPFLRNRCDYFEHAENFIVSRKVNLWSADSEEFIYVFVIPNLTEESFKSSISFVESDWQQHAHIGPGHMYTYITPLFICENAEQDAVKLLKKFRKYKSYRFSFWGWSEFHTALVDCSNGKIFTNRSGRCIRKSLGRIIQNS